MLTNDATLRQPVLPGTATQKVVIVNGSAEILELLETVLDAGHYDVVFVESSQHAYSQIKRVQPNLVILCVRIDDAEGFQVLSMLKLDAGHQGHPGAHLHDRGGRKSPTRTSRPTRPSRTCSRGRKRPSG